MTSQGHGLSYQKSMALHEVTHAQHIIILQINKYYVTNIRSVFLLDRNKDDEEESPNVFDDTLESLQSNKEPKGWYISLFICLVQSNMKYDKKN